MNTVLDRLRGRSASPPLHPLKLRAIDSTFERGDIDSVADLGGVWAVDGGYTFHTLERHSPARAVLVDDEVTGATRDRARQHPQLEIVEGSFGDPSVAERVGEVGAVILFDVLLHQVAPDWNEILGMYGERTRYLVIVQPQYILANESVRLIDLGRERYMDLVPDVPVHHEAWDRLDDYVPERGRAFRDVHDIWQWGMTDADLRRRADELGFELVYFENAGSWQGIDAFENHGFVFRRR